MAARIKNVERYTTGLLDISAAVCYNADNIRQGQPEIGCCTESSFMKGVAENDMFRYEQSVQPQ